MVDRRDGNGHRTAREPDVPEMDILWITAGLSCDGDSIAVTSATQPAIEDVVMGAIPGLPKVNLHNPVLAYGVGEDFLVPFRLAAEGKAPRPFVLVVEGSIPNERLHAEGYWAAMGTDPKRYVVGPDASIEDVDLGEEEVRLRDGSRLTEQRAGQIAEEKLAEIRRRNLVPGRKSLTGGSAHSPRVQ